MGIMLLAVLFLILPRVYQEVLVFLHCLEDLIFLDQVVPICFEAQLILLLLVFNFQLEVNLKLGDNPKLGEILQFMGNLCMDYKPNLGIFLYKEINNFLGGKLLKKIHLYPLFPGNHFHAL
jgi:hypothetical protein